MLLRKQKNRERSMNATNLAKYWDNESCKMHGEKDIFCLDAIYCKNFSLFLISTDFLPRLKVTATLVSDEDIQLVHTIIDHLRSHR